MSHDVNFYFENQKIFLLSCYLSTGMSGNISFSERYINEGREGKDIDLPLFDLGTIIDATNNFSVHSKLGEGGFGPVYKVQQFKHIHYWRHSNKSPTLVLNQATQFAPTLLYSMMDRRVIWERNKK